MTEVLTVNNVLLSELVLERGFRINIYLYNYAYTLFNFEGIGLNAARWALVLSIFVIYMFFCI